MYRYFWWQEKKWNEKVSIAPNKKTMHCLFFFSFLSSQPIFTCIDSTRATNNLVVESTPHYCHVNLSFFFPFFFFLFSSHSVLFVSFLKASLRRMDIEKTFPQTDQSHLIHIILLYVSARFLRIECRFANLSLARSLYPSTRFSIFKDRNIYIYTSMYLFPSFYSLFFVCCVLLLLCVLRNPQISFWPGASLVGLRGW